MENNKFLQSWSEHLDLTVLDQILPTLRRQKQAGKKLFPEPQYLFYPFQLCDYEKVKVVVFGNTPFTNGMSNGLAYGVKNNIKTHFPFALNCIGQAIFADVYLEDPSNWSILNKTVADLWGPSLASQGVLMYNTTPTTDKKRSYFYQKLWAPFTQEVKKAIQTHKNKPIIVDFTRKEDFDNLTVFHPKFPNSKEYDLGFLNQNLFTRINNELEKNNNEPLRFE
jgi:uracil DNA glycosylase